MTPPPTPTCCCARSSTSSRAAGCARACTSPGSRSTPLVLSLAREPRLRCYSHIDERCAGFFALGLAKAIGPAGRGRLHVGHRRGRAAAGGDRGARGARAAARADRRPPARAARDRRRADDRPAQALRRRGEVVLRGRRARRRRPSALRWMRTLACRAYWTRARGPPRRRCTSTSRCASRSCPTSRCPRTTTGRARRRARTCAARRARRAPAPRAARRSRELARRAPRGVVVAGRDERDAGARRARGRRASPSAPAGRCSPTRCPARAAARRRSRTTTRCCATPRFAARAAPRPRAARRRPADLQAAARVARRPARRAAGRARPRGRLAGPGRGARRDSLARRPGGALAALARERARRAARARLARRAGAAPTSAPREAIAGALGDAGCREPAVAARARRAAARRGDAVRRLLDAGARRRDVLAGARRTRRACSPTAAPTASTAPSPPRSAPPPPATGPVVLLIGDVALAHDIGGLLAARAARPDADDRAARQRRRRDLRLPAGRRGATRRRALASRRTSYTRHVATPPGLDFARGGARSTALAHERAERRPRASARALERALGAARTRRIVEVRTRPRRATSRCTARVWQRRRRRRACAQPASTGSSACELDLGLGQLGRRVGVAHDADAGVAARDRRRAAARSAARRRTRRPRSRRSSRPGPAYQPRSRPSSAGISGAARGRAARRRRPASGAAAPASSIALERRGELRADRRREVLDVGDPHEHRLVGAAATHTACGRSARSMRRATIACSSRSLASAAAARRGGRRPPGRRCAASSRPARPSRRAGPRGGPAARGWRRRTRASPRPTQKHVAGRERLAQHAEHRRRVVRRAARGPATSRASTIFSSSPARIRSTARATAAS